MLKVFPKGVPFLIKKALRLLTLQKKTNWKFQHKK